MFFILGISHGTVTVITCIGLCFVFSSFFVFVLSSLCAAPRLPPPLSPLFKSSYTMPDQRTILMSKTGMTTDRGVRLISWNTKDMNNVTKIGKVLTHWQHLIRDIMKLISKHQTLSVLKGHGWATYFTPNSLRKPGGLHHHPQEGSVRADKHYLTLMVALS